MSWQQKPFKTAELEPALEHDGEKNLRIGNRGTRKEMERQPKKQILQTLAIYKIPTVHNKYKQTEEWTAEYPAGGKTLADPGHESLQVLQINVLQGNSNEGWEDIQKETRGICRASWVYGGLEECSLQTRSNLLLPGTVPDLPLCKPLCMAGLRHCVTTLGNDSWGCQVLPLVPMLQGVSSSLHSLFFQRRAQHIVHVWKICVERTTKCFGRKRQSVSTVVKSTRQRLVQILVVSVTGCVTLNMLIRFPDLWFSYQCNDANLIMLGRLNVRVFIACLLQCLGHNKHQ